MLRLVDAHCHLVSYKYSEEEIPGILERSLAAGVDRIIATGTDEGNWNAYLELAACYPENIFAGLGIHPTDVHEASPQWRETLRSFALDGKIKALGETGLDYYHNAPEGWETSAFRKRQQEFLREHFALAEEAGLNIVIHTRDRSGADSFEDALRIAEEYSGKVRPMFHCFIGTKEQAQRVLDINGVLSFTGIITFKNAQDVLEVASWCPDGSFLVETDAPYLAPDPFRGKRNEPAYVRHVAEKLAAARNTSLEALADITSNTAESFFSL